MLVKKGFTLVELSIVLVIIGLLIGGILVGQSLIDSARVNRFIQEVQYYEIAAKMYKQQFKYWPGDHPTAYAIYGAACGINNAPATASWNGCNGNGDGILASGNYTESSSFWYHLSHSGLLGDERFSVMYVFSEPSIIPGVSIPKFSYNNKLQASGVSNVSWLYGKAPGSAGTNGIYFGMCYVGGAGCSSIEYFPVLDAMALDKKVDDGRPSYGIVQPFVASAHYGTHCVTHPTPSITQYIPDDERGCILPLLILNEDQAILH